MEVVFGILLVVGIVSFKSGFNYWQMTRLKKRLDAAQAAMQVKDWDTAIHLLNECVKMQPGAIPVRSLYGVALTQAGHLPEAEEQLRFAVDLEPKRGDSHFNLGYFIATKFPDRFEDAAKAFEQALEYEPRMRAMFESAHDLEGFRSSNLWQSWANPSTDNRG